MCLQRGPELSHGGGVVQREEPRPDEPLHSGGAHVRFHASVGLPDTGVDLRTRGRRSQFFCKDLMKNKRPDVLYCLIDMSIVSILSP